jgi:hypothetical protein
MTKELMNIIKNKFRFLNSMKNSKKPLKINSTYYFATTGRILFRFCERFENYSTTRILFPIFMDCNKKRELFKNSSEVDW